MFLKNKLEGLLLLNGLMFLAVYLRKGICMFTMGNVRTILMVFGVLLFVASSSLSYADWAVGVNIGDDVRHHDDRHHYDEGRAQHDERHFYRYHEHPHFGLHLGYIPDGYFTVWVGGTRYFYYDGLYYVRTEDGYMLVAPPVGAYVSAIPPDFHAVMINGRIYYTDNDIYYLLTEHHGYEVVQRPMVVVPPAPVVVAQPTVTVVATQPAPPVVVTTPAVDTQDSFIVNVPNDKGGYIPVVIKRSGNGFVGPQGEFYAQFPKVAQLKAMYGK
jgi:hypothetical protein